MVDNSEPHVGVYLYNQRSNLFHGNTYVYFTLLLRSLMNFIIKSETSSNSSIQNINTRNTHHLHRPNANLSCFQRSILYAGIKIFKSLPTSLTIIKNEKVKFKAAL